MVMDHLKLDTYASKGLLLDLQEVLQPMEEDGTLLSNITTAYKEADGTRYAVPLQFGLLLAVGRDVQPEEMSSMDAIAKAVSGVADTMKIALNTDLSYKLDGMTGAIMNGGIESSVVNNYYNNDNSRTVNQTNNSPKSLSRLEIYRQTKNAVKM